MGMTEAFVVRYRTTPETADENQRLVEAVYAALAADAPDGLRYQTFRLADGVTFVHVALGGGVVLSQLPAFQEFQRELGSRVVAGPDASAATVIGAYVGAT
jgi:hypothetical protein